MHLLSKHVKLNMLTGFYYPTLLLCTENGAFIFRKRCFYMPKMLIRPPDNVDVAFMFRKRRFYLPETLIWRPENVACTFRKRCFICRKRCFYMPKRWFGVPKTLIWRPENAAFVCRKR